jgi:galactonate dehydratase
VKIETDAGIHGLGESGTAGRELALAGALDHFREFLIGQDPRRIEDINQVLYRSQYFEGGTIITAAASAIDIALWDILGKHLNTPVWQLLGGSTRQHVTCFCDLAAGEGATWADRASDLVTKGWATIRCSPGMPGESDAPDNSLYEPWESMQWTAARLQEIREQIGPDVRLAVDFHHRLNVAEAAEFCRMIDDVGLMFLEEPIRAESPDAYAALRAMSSMPFAIGEEFSGIYVFAPFIERGLCNYVRLDLCNVGGFTSARKVAALAEAHYIDVMPHNPLGPISTASAVHFCIATSNFSLLEYNWSVRQQPEDLFPTAMQIESDRFPIPTEPGLGVEFNEKAAPDYPFEYWEPPHLRRRDNSYTNW